MISVKLAKLLSENSKYSYEACLYIIKTYTHLFGSVFLTLFIALILDKLVLATVIMFTAMLLRSGSGGAHSKSKTICTIISLIIPVGGAYIANLIKLNNQTIIILSFILFTISLLTILKYAPADTLQKPIVSSEFRKQLRFRSIIFITIIEIIILILYYIECNLFIQVSVAIFIGLIWQMFTITPLGYNFLKTIDDVFIREG